MREQGRELLTLVCGGLVFADAGQQLLQFALHEIDLALEFGSRHLARRVGKCRPRGFVFARTALGRFWLGGGLVVGRRDLIGLRTRNGRLKGQRGQKKTNQNQSHQ